MTIQILIFALLFVIPLVIGAAYVARDIASRYLREHAIGGQPGNLVPVALDRNPEMPHQRGATS